MKQRIISIAAALFLCLTLLPATAFAAAEQDKSAGWIELLAVNLPREETVYTAGSGTITWTPELNSDGTAVSGTVTLDSAVITAEKGGIVLPVPFTLALEGSSTITTQTGDPVTPEGVECAVSSRLASLTITGPGSLTINSAGRAIEAFGDLTIRGGATVTVNTQDGDHAVYSGNIKTDDINIERGNITIEDSTLFITANSTNPPLYANGGRVSIQNSHVYVKSAKTGTQYGVAAIFGRSVSMKDSDVAAIGSESQAGAGVIRFSSAESDFVMDGGILYVENIGSGGYDFDYSDPYATASNNAVICYKGNLNYMIVNGDNIQYAGCTYDESSHKVTSVQHGYVNGGLTWNEKMPAPQDYFVYLYSLRYNSGWNYIPATLTIPTGTETEIPALGISRPGGKLINNGTLTSVIGIRNFGTIEGTGTLNASVQTRETVDASNIKDTFTAHGDATFWTSFTKIGATSSNGVTTQNIIVIPAGASLTIPQGATLDATADGTITVETLANYYTNNGTLVVNGTAKFPAGTDLSSLGTVTGTGQVIIGGSAAYPITVTGGTADKSLATAGETVTLTPEPDSSTRRFKRWTVSPDVTISENNTFTMPGQAVAVTGEYDTLHTVTFDTQGGSPIASQTVVDGEKVQKLGTDPTREGYIFDGWYTGADCKAAYDFDSAVTGPLTLYAKWRMVLPDPPAAGDGKQYQLVMDKGISAVPAGLQGTYQTTEALESAMKVKITEAAADASAENTAVYDVELQISTDGGATWTKATAANFPANGLTVTLPYPAGTNSSYTFTVVHMFTTADFGKTPGDTETPRVTNMASGLQFTVTGLSPISVGWVQPGGSGSGSGSSSGSSGSSGSSSYTVTVEEAEHGKVTSDRRTASRGDTVTLTVTADSGYALNTLTVTDSRGNEVTLAEKGGEIYTFTMPGRAVTVKAAFAPLPDDTETPCTGGAECPSRAFSDLDTGEWYHEAVDYVLQNDLMGGYGGGQFGPDDNLTRAQFAQLLFNREGRPAVNYLLQYSDVADGAWYTEAVRWAASQGIVSGYGNGMFGPDDNITREQLAVMLWRYAGSPAAAEEEVRFTDAEETSGYALDALRWAVENGIINGCGNGHLAPQGPATRAQVAQMLKNYLER